MQLGDHLGFFGIVLTLLAVVASVLFPTQRWIGYASGVLALLTIAWWITSYFARNPTKQPVVVALPYITGANQQSHGPFALFVSNLSADAAEGVRIDFRDADVDPNTISPQQLVIGDINSHQHAVSPLVLIPDANRINRFHIEITSSRGLLVEEIEMRHLQVGWVADTSLFIKGRKRQLGDFLEVASTGR